MAALRAKIMQPMTNNSRTSESFIVYGAKSKEDNPKKNPIIAKGMAKMVWENLTRLK
jgi:hypothetical protein